MNKLKNLRVKAFTLVEMLVPKICYIPPDNNRFCRNIYFVY